ncbi:AAA family ATPase (plasmid) [Rouxiella badensis]|uniref:Plasmid-partitioning protein SopA n=1 Tax=Rouxiella badensis TaxID=1646377 RepID=A0A1X0WAZ9_9GAMM|nr:AAA family ATPase [Rouxiella badensis]ORJ23972.1 plasmid-partitioning protein SopA [Rouxiella badensis]WAT03224.1 AAA family ATPase [Rouxiella badensis]WAT03225.1 AAA family ATPase [Rouxiella badensis]WAT03255.1 AAA family ATPase [Rouxiella badensis]
MNLLERLDVCLSRGAAMTKLIAEDMFGDDSPDSRAITRRWGIQEAALMVGVSQPTIRNAEDDGRLPPPDMVKKGRIEQRDGYTIQQINTMREVFGTLPYRPEGEDPVVVGIAQHKGGAFKTATAVHLAQKLALDGLRVLLCDANDPQATASLYHGYVPDLHIHADDTLLPFYLGQRTDAMYAIKPTCWPNLDIIPSCLAIHRIESEVMPLHDKNMLGGIAPQMLLRSAIESVWDGYDVVIIDSAPSLGIGAANVVCASDVLVIPTPAELYDYASANQFFAMLRDLMAALMADGGDVFEPDVRVLITKYSLASGSQSEMMAENMRKAFGDMVLDEVVRVTDEVGKGQLKMRTVFEQAANQRSSSRAWNNAIKIWEPVCSEIFNKLIKPRWNNKGAE